MPIYEYVCPNCGHKFELRSLEFGKPEEASCPKCGTDSPKVFSTYNFQFSPFLSELSKGTMV